MTEIKKLVFNDKQMEIINAFKKGQTRFFLEGGVRSGKSLVACWLIDYICTNVPGMEAYVYRDTFESIRKDTHRIMEDKPGFLNGKGEWKQGHKEFHYSNGSKIFFQYTKGGKHTLGQTAGLIYFEQVESMKEDDFDLILPRLSQWGPAAIEEYERTYRRYYQQGRAIKPKNILIMSANPKANWVKGRYIDTDGLPELFKFDDNNGRSKTVSSKKDIPQDKQFEIVIQDNLKKERIKRFHLSTYDNIHNLGDEYLAGMQTASEQFKKQYYDGSWEFNTGLIYPEFKSTDFEDGGNVVNFEWEAVNNFEAKKYRTFVAIDPGYVKSKFAALFCAILPGDILYFFDEISRNGKNAEEWDKIGPIEFAKSLKEKYRDNKFQPNTTLIDPAAHNENSGMGSVSGQLLKQGISAISAKKIKEYQAIMGIKDLFKVRKILVNARCQEFIKELGLFAWDERKVTNGDQKPLDEDNDFCDCMRYIYAATPHPTLEAKTYKDVFNKEYSAEKLYQNWLKGWFGIKDKKPNILGIDNKGKGNWGI